MAEPGSQTRSRRSEDRLREAPVGKEQSAPQGTTQLRCTLALVELGLYRRPGSSELLMVPSVVARTSEIVRAVLEVTEAKALRTVRAPELTSSPRTPATQGARKAKVITDEFYSTMLERSGPKAVSWVQELEEAVEQRGLQVTLLSASLMVKLHDPGGSGQHFTLSGISQAGRFSVGWLGRQTVQAGYHFGGSPPNATSTACQVCSGRRR